MIFPSHRVRIMVAMKPIDFRKGQDGLAALVKNELRKDPFPGTVFVFRARKRIERLEKLVAAFRQAAFGRRSEKSDPDQLELALEDLETDVAAISAEEDAEDRAAKRPSRLRATNRRSLPTHLPRIEEVIEPESLTCGCGGCLHCIGEDMSERLDVIPAQFRVIVTRRPKYACRSCT